MKAQKRLSTSHLIIFRLCLIAVAAVAITVTGIVFHQSPFRMVPLYVSLVVGLLQAQANRYAPLIGGFNAILHAAVSFHFGTYASAASALFTSCPLQLATFVRWSRHSYKHSTEFRRLNTKQRLVVIGGFIVCYAAVYAMLTAADSSYRVLDTVSSLLGLLISILTMLSFIEYTYLMIPSGILSIALNINVTMDYPAQITYVIYSVYSFICIVQQFFTVRNLYAEQRADKAAVQQ
ncbi:MAG: nicotinamide mononucleotide transporter [Clostridia bacterium]|nr:nicotinamide mononucleotide transporter [Clostridia bacterium]